MNNEPVAWILKENPQIEGEVIPLYTHSHFDKSVKAKTLTDEEIHQIFRDESGFEIDTCPIAILDFARAILKKASEK
jgi:hypothetical protein